MVARSPLDQPPSWIYTCKGFLGVEMRDDLQAACLMDGIELFEPIGRGGCATVWRARWREREVAVKVLEGPGVLSGRRLTHPAILDVLGEGRALGLPYQILERFPTDLGRFLGGRPLRGDHLRQVLLPLLDATEFAHRNGVIHGDIKPANVLLDPDTSPLRVALADFGHAQDAAVAFEASMLSRDARSGSSVGTLPYMAPERLAGDPASRATDVYAVGVLLFEALTGRLPTGLELPSELQRGVSRQLDELVKTCMARAPSTRPSISDLRRGLLRALTGSKPRPAAEDAADMVYIPGGFLVIGDRDDPDARPMREVQLPPFWIDLTPVTNENYLEFARATGASCPRSWERGMRLPARLRKVPVTGISCEEAQAYAHWARKRLLTEFEWERAAQGPEHRRYPYGESLDPARIHADPRRLAPVGSLPEGASSEGVLDLTGNGWEWTSSPFLPYGTKGKETGAPRVIRGGYDPANPRSASATNRVGLRPDARDAGVTFRCALDADV